LHCNRIPFGSYLGFALIGRRYIWGFLGFGFGFGLVWSFYDPGSGPIRAHARDWAGWLDGAGYWL
jgi:hypothetical protein